MKPLFQTPMMFETPADGGGGGEQASEVQGAGTPQQDPNGPYLEGVPEELHPYVRQALTKKDADVTKGFQEHKEFRSQYEPYAKIDGFSDIPAEEMSNLVGFYHNVASSPEAFAEFVQSASQELGISPELDEDSWAKMGQEKGWLAGEDDDGSSEDRPLTRAEFEQMMSERESKAQAEQQMTQAQQQAEQQLESRYQELEKELGEADDKTRSAVRQHVIALAVPIAESNPGHPDPLGEAFKQVMELRGSAVGDSIERKLQQSNGHALSQGSADTTPERTSWNGNGMDPKEAALARLRSS